MGAYSYILPQELEMNREKLALPYDATSEPFQILLDRFEEARTYSLDGNLPITDAQLINSGLVALQNTGVLNRFIDLWTDKPAEDRVTWLSFISYDVLYVSYAFLHVSNDLPTCSYAFCIGRVACKKQQETN